MITELRKKFIAIAMLSLLGTMAALCIAIAIGNHCITANRADKVIQLLYLNDGAFPTPDEDIRPSMHGGFQVTTETPFETRYFIAHIDKTGKVDSVELDHIAAFDEDTVVTTIEKILKQDKAAGYADYYRFGSFKTSDGGYTLVVLDCFVQLQSAYSIIRVIAGIFVLCAGIVFALLLVLSERVIRPFVRNWESQRRFITDASHELKTPLAILSADLGLVDETDDNRPWLEGAREQIARMDTLIRSLVELARSEEALPASAVTAVCVSDAAASAAESFTPLAQASGKELKTDIEQNLNISGVKDDIARLISLLLDNAVKYCDDGGTIELLALKRGKNIVIEISNPCADLDASQISHYFDRFYRADSSRARTTGGSGIGLSTAKAIVTRHRGRISDRYENGVITFAVSIPALHDQAS